jgi:double-strand break repair protein MRE11
MFDDRIDLVVWGHEHDCRIEPEPVAKKEYYITQPGSSVATSLAHGEAIPKWVDLPTSRIGSDSKAEHPAACPSVYRKVGLLRIQGRKFQLDPLPLKTVRPFKMEDIVLQDEAELEENDLDLDKRETITAFLARKVRCGLTSEVDPRDEDLSMLMP